MKSILIICALGCSAIAASAQNITYAEYAIDIDNGPGLNTAVAIPASTDATATFTINLAAVSPGYHQLYIRTRANDGKWSQTIRRRIEVSTPSTGIIQAEYALDIDYGPGQNTAVTIPTSADISSLFTINLTGITPGFHQLYLRTKSNDGKWSHVIRRRIEVFIPSSGISAATYSLDVDNGIGSNANTLVALPLSPDQTATFTVNLSATTPGFHQLYIRIVDDKGIWSHTIRRKIEMSVPSTQVSAAEYFFNTDPGVGKAIQVPFANPLEDGSFSFNIPFENIPDSIGVIYFRVRDIANKNWSVTQLQRDSVVSSLPGSNLWSNVATWSNHKIPGMRSIIVLRNSVIVDIDAFCRSLAAIKAGASVVVNPGKKLEINGQ